jgi:peptide/nickel transport system substrate-binding protein
VKTILLGAVSAALIATAASSAFAPAAQAQKSEDTIRLAVNDPFNTIDAYTIGHDEANTFSRAIYQNLINFDEHKKQWVPVLAKSFKRIDNKTIEFELREGIKFHNGNDFDAEDVKYTLEYLVDPASKVIFKDRYSWIDSVEILSKYKVRLHEKESFSTDLGTLAYRVRIYDKETHQPLADKSDYGRMGIGTGQYKLVSLDRNKGAVAERYDGFKGIPGYFNAPLKRMRAVFIPDQQTRVAELLTGGIDLLRNIGPDEAKDLAGKQSNLKVSATASGVLLYVTLDAAGRSANKMMTDERVRKAFIMSVDREKLVRALVPGGDRAEMANAPCISMVFGCAPSTTPYPYNPEEAKRLLAEAGYPNGVDLQIDVFDPVKYIAEGIAGEVRKTGFRASVQPLNSTVYVKKRGDGEFTAFVGNYPTATHPDMVTLWDFFFAGNRDYYHDQEIARAYAAGNQEFDDAKRVALYTPALDRVNQMAYIMPLSEMPMLWAGDKDIELMPDPLSAGLPLLGDFKWKK